MFIIFLVFVAVVLYYINQRLSNSEPTTRKKRERAPYNYNAKQNIMTPTEQEFFKKLERVVSEKYYTFPQIHLSAVLDGKIKGQNWNAAFRHINGKSVDYVLCSKYDLRPVYAIELDDHTHSRQDRVTRDTEVERIFSQASIPLVRFKDRSISEEQIIQALSNARRLP